MADILVLRPDLGQPAQLVPAGVRRHRSPRRARASPSATPSSGSLPGGVGVMALALAVGVAVRASGRYFSGDKLVLAVSGAREVDATSAPQLMNVVQEMAIAANMPMPKVYVIDDTAPNAFATGRDPQHAVDRDHDRPAREARPRGAPGRHRPRAVARPQPRHPVRAARRRDGRRDRAPGRLLPALHVLGRRPAVSEPRQRRRRRRQADRLRRRDRPGDPRARSSAGSSSSRSAASASTWPTRRASS